jgi:beta-glucosidase
MALYLLLSFFALGFSYWLVCVYFSRKHPNVNFTMPFKPPNYPPHFLYGTATSAHQIEGGNLWNDWHHAEEQGLVGYHSGRACDHWNRTREDLALMKLANSNAYRFSIEWSRVQPTEDAWDEAAWEHYIEEISQLREAQIVPMATLLHFTLPQWLAARGGLLAPEFPEKFAEFAAEAARRCWSMVEHWCTLNEPNVQIFQGYLQGVWPPLKKKSPEEATKAFVALLRAHAAASREIRSVSPEAQIGVAINLICFDPHSRGSLPDWLAMKAVDNAYNWAFYDSILKGRIQFQLPGQAKVDEPLDTLLRSADFIGVNYYTRYLVRFSLGAEGFVEWQPGPGPRSDLDWEIYPEGLLRVMQDAYQRYRLPIYITENGVADQSGEKRGAFIERHLHAVSRALQGGLPVEGYFHWSLLDNFEWAEGFAPRFGLYQTKYETMERSETAGLEVFRRLSPLNQ